MTSSEMVLMAGDV